MKLLSQFYLYGLIVLVSVLLNAYYCSSVADSKGRTDNELKKKAVSVGEMSDLFANETIRSSEPNRDYEYGDDLNHNRIRRYKPIHPNAIHAIPPATPHTRRKSPNGSMFVPVAAYSITKTRNNHHKPSRSSAANSYRKRQGGPIRRNPDLGHKQTESAVYGYMQRPEIIEFRGQYFYGPRPGDPYDGPLTPAGSSAEGVKYPPYPLDPVDPHSTSASNPYQSYGNQYGYGGVGSGYGSGGYGSGGYGSGYGPGYGAGYGGYNAGKYFKGGLGPGGLLLATLPLILAPMLSYLFTPMVIPITATVAAGRRRRRDAPMDATLEAMMSDTNMNSLDQKLLKDASFDTQSSTSSSPLTSQPNESNRPNSQWLHSSDRFNDTKFKEAQVVVEYLRKVHIDERATTRAVANYLQCDGMLSDGDHCIERLSCEFSDPHNSDAPELDRAVTSIILGHILANDFIATDFKSKLKLAAIHGKDNPGKCELRYSCMKVETSPHKI